jgi:hypothetical protein
MRDMLIGSNRDVTKNLASVILNSTGGNRGNGETKSALFSLFPPVRLLKNQTETLLREANIMRNAGIQEGY